MPLDYCSKRGPQPSQINRTLNAQADRVVERRARIATELRGEENLLLRIGKRCSFQAAGKRHRTKQPRSSHDTDTFLECRGDLF